MAFRTYSNARQTKIMDSGPFNFLEWSQYLQFPSVVAVEPFSFDGRLFG
ncbi:hypothetical protein [Flavihumibacter fluvii]|nr:hypothetical protein [Flavihumibacter fluvii]ULQ52013.1 hypothetical protein KJS93_18130 [Flavihumibacter fluvii]